MKIIYEIDNKCYINLTNKCTNDCVFCVRNLGNYEGYNLWLDKEPSSDEVIDAIRTANKDYDEFIFCGYGEPTIKLTELISIATWLKTQGKSVRLNTNGQANLIHKQNIAPKLVGLLDMVSVSLNASTAKKYQEICKSAFGVSAFDALLDFAKCCQIAGINTRLSIVDSIGEIEVENCKKLAENLQLPLLVRTEIK